MCIPVYSCKFERFLKTYFLEINCFPEDSWVLSSIPVNSRDFCSIPLNAYRQI